MPENRSFIAAISPSFNQSGEHPMKYSNNKILASFGAAVLAAMTFNADAGLYPPAAPPDSAFVRVFNATPQGKLKATIGDHAIPDAPPLDASAYVFLPPGS